MQKQIIDFFPYFDQTGKELLQLRINVLKDYVDKFIICESNKTHSGLPCEYMLDQRIGELGLPRDKIEVIQLTIPEDDKLPVELIDVFNCYENNKNHDSIRARTRERLQKDSLLQAIDKYSDNTLFLVSDSDEIINPDYLEWLSNTVLTYPGNIIKVPLVHLEGKANLRVFKVDGNPKRWDGGMFMCTKEHLKRASPTQIRSNVDNPFTISYLHQDGIRVEDMGWHFSWMGGPEKCAVKRRSFTHYNDTFSFIKGNSYNGNEMAKLHHEEPMAGRISPSGEVDTVLVEYSQDLLPKQLFEHTNIRDYLLPQYANNGRNLLDNEYLAACNMQTDINQHLPILKQLAIDCASVTEMGTRDGQSTRAFLSANVKLRAYDLELDEKVLGLFHYASSLGKDVSYEQADVLKLDIEPVDLLFIDTWHTYDQLSQELKLHGNKAQKYLAFHDTHTYGVSGEGGGGQGLLPAIIEFLIENPHWRFKIHRTVNNGLTVLERIDND
jgi:beta-1,4-mannosyl-glycoprotein beta-1,4-N-acetylglucosaminyltransferase